MRLGGIIKDGRIQVYYAALVDTPTSQLPAYILLKNGKEPEPKYIKDYQQVIQSQLLPTDSLRDLGDKKAKAQQQGNIEQLYEQFWKPIAQHLSMKDIKTLYFSADVNK